MISSLKRREKDTHTSYYYSLEPYGLEDDEVELEPEKKQQQSLFSKFRKSKKDISQNKFAFDPNDRVIAPDRDASKPDAVNGQDRDLLE